jgi:two-component system, chemotaxis family, response regulator WspF
MRIAIVNDLQLAIELLRRVVATIPGATVAWIAKDGAEAVAKCAADVPDVILMDMIMPVMDGVEATRRIMRATPCPILVVTATVTGNASKVFEALGAGAIDAVATPGLAPDGSVVHAEPLAAKVRTVSLLAGVGAREGLSAGASQSAQASRGMPTLVAIGASTGGPEALATVLRSLPKPAPWPIVIVQHIDEMFASGLSEWLTRETGHRVLIAASDAVPEPGCVHLASSSDHLIIHSGRLRYTDVPREVLYRPSVDVFFESLLTAGVQPGVAVILTGMGRDGASGMASLRTAGWTTIAQDRATSVVWGMPGAATQMGAAMQTLPIDTIAAAISAAMDHGRKSRDPQHGVRD